MQEKIQKLEEALKKKSEEVERIKSPPVKCTKTGQKQGKHWTHSTTATN